VKSLSRPTFRWTVRVRLAVLYAGLFLVFGLALLGVTYGLVANSLVTSGRSSSERLANPQFVAFCKQELGSRNLPSNSQFLAECQAAVVIGANAGAAEQRAQTLHQLLVYSVIGLFGMTIAAAAVGWLMAGGVLRPVRVITAAARRASEGQLAERLAMRGPQDELKELADTFDNMLARLDTAFSSQRRFVANASHELRTPLTVMRTAIEVTLGKPGRTQEQLETMVGEVRIAIGKMEALIDALLTLARSDRGLTRTELIDLATVAEDVVDLSSATARELGLRVDSSLDSAQIAGDRLLVERMVGNMVDNALRHNVLGGWVRVATGETNGTAFVRVTNSGVVVPGEMLPQLFEPFTRLNDRVHSGDGLGLGLSIVRSVSAAHGGAVRAKTQPEGGLNVVVEIPSSHEPSGRPGQPQV